MAITETRQLPPKFIEDLGTDLGTQLIAQSGRPTVAPGIAGLSQLTGESADDFAKRQQAAQEFDIRKQSIAGLAPTVAGQTALQTEAQRLAEAQAGQSGIASFQPFLQRAQGETALAGALGTAALGGLGAAGQELTQAGTALGTAGTTIGGVPLGAQAFQQDVSQFMSPYQSQVIDASLAEFDRNKQIQEQSIRDQQAALGALGSGRAGVQLAEFGTGAARERALLQAGLLQQGFQQAQGARQQDIQNRFGLGQAQAGLAGQQAAFAGQRGALAGATQGLGAFRSGLGSQQIGLGQAQEGILGSNIGRLGSLGAINQAQAQAEADATREANRQAAMLPQENLQRYGAQVTGLMGGYPGTTTQTFAPNPTPLQTALGIGSTLAGLYLGRR
jgi:hypothetical protein